MRLPRSTPFLRSRSDELHDVYAHFYPSAGQAADPARALATVQVWLNRSACPYAVEATASLVQASLFDSHIAPQLRTAEIAVRLTYTLAITRFVNSFVDAYQNGMFAQSIASIAARIEMPLWFVDIRHAGTHEELPSLQVCREAGQAALEWLHRHFWVPSLFPQPSDEEQHAEEAEEEAQEEEDNSEAIAKLNELLREYKRIGKLIARDHSLAGRYKAEVLKLCRKVQNWINVRYAATQGGARQIAARMGRKRTREEMEDQSIGEEGGVAMRELVGELIKPGGIIPLSKSKRAKSAELPDELDSTWSPLLDFIRTSSGTGFTALLFEEMAAAMAGDGESSYKLTCESWVRKLAARGDESVEMSLVSTCLRYPCERTASILRFLCERNPKLSERVAPLLQLLENNVDLVVEEPEPAQSEAEAEEQIGYEDEVKAMEERLQQFKGIKSAKEAMHVHAETRKRPLPEGWSYAGPDWKPTPIGCLDDSIPNLHIVL